ncbi:MAG: phosphodiester glycosidase family protein [Rhodobacterales bacterium]|nr:phosphodiester glycosidase family protein [Rhodobacterales bacterium]
MVRIDPQGFSVLPLFTRDAPSDETRLALTLAGARLGLPVVAVPPADQRIAPREVDGTLRLARRAGPRIGAACAPLRLLRTVASGLGPDELLINANHFLFLPPEVETPFDAYGDPIGLTLADGLIETPPQARRACLVIGAEGPAIRRIGFADTGIRAADQRAFVPHPFGPPDRTGPGTAFALFHGSHNGATPPGAANWDVAFVGRHPVALSQGGGLSIPRAGCVLRCATRTEAEAVAAGPLTYVLAGLMQGVQSGPVIVEDGLPTDTAPDVFAAELMSGTAPRPDAVAVSPHAWAADWHKTRAARMAAGISPDGRVFFCAVEGTSSFLRDGAAKGATLHDLACLMITEGAARAMHLDGGGSTQVFCHGGGALIEPRDVHHAMTDSPAQFDRPLPLGLRLF